MSATYMSVAELAERWCCHRSIIYRQINAGHLAALHIGQTIRIPTAEVERFETENTSAPTKRRGRAA